MTEIQLHSKLLNWFENNKRDLPWRNQKDPYKIWLSEVILQQTRVSQGIQYYYNFCEAFPTVQDLAKANEEEILKLWQGLGYYSRARNLHFAAKQIGKSTFPNTYKDLLLLKGVGEYTAGAIASIAFGEAVTLVDGNVYRLFARLFGIDTPIDSSKGKKEFSELAKSLLYKKDPGTWNQALMEFGALHCKPKNPHCETCILKSYCKAFENSLQKKLPYKKGKTKQQTLYLSYAYFVDGDYTYIIQRPKNGIWGGLFEFPRIESKQIITPEIFEKELCNLFPKLSDFEILNISKSFKHILSHRIFHVNFLEIKVNQQIQADSFIRIPLSELNKYPVSRLMEKYIQGHLTSSNII